MILGGGVLFEGTKTLPSNRDNRTEGFEGILVILKDSNDQSDFRKSENCLLLVFTQV